MNRGRTRAGVLRRMALPMEEDGEALVLMLIERMRETAC